MAAINQIIKGNNKDSSGFKTPELVILNKKKKTPQTIKVPKIPKDTKIPNLKNLLFKELYANTKKRSGIIKNGTNCSLILIFSLLFFLLAEYINLFRILLLIKHSLSNLFSFIKII